MTIFYKFKFDSKLKQNNNNNNILYYNKKTHYARDYNKQKSKKI